MADILNHYIGGKEVPGKSGRFTDDVETKYCGWKMPSYFVSGKLVYCANTT